MFWSISGPLTFDEGDGGPGLEEEEGKMRRRRRRRGCPLIEVVLTEGGVEGVATHD